MPQPQQGESESAFVKRCIPYLIHEGKHPNTEEGRSAAAGECYGIYRNKSDDDLNKEIEAIKIEIKENKEEIEYLEQELDERKKQNEYLEYKINKKQELIGKDNGDEPIEEILDSEDEIDIKSDDIIKFKGKVGKIVKVIK